MRTPNPAVQARTSVAAARTGLLTTYARHPAGQVTTEVSLTPRADGTVDLLISAAAPCARQLIARPVATLELAPTGCAPVLLHGAVRRLPGIPGEDLRFRLGVAAVRVGTPAVLIDENDYAAAAPDPLAADVPAILEHLNDVHPEALAACLRAVGHPVDFAYAAGLDESGLSLLAVTTAGVDRVRLQFPRRVSDVSELPTSLLLALNPPGRSGPR